MTDPCALCRAQMITPPAARCAERCYVVNIYNIVWVLMLWYIKGHMSIDWLSLLGMYKFLLGMSQKGRPGWMHCCAAEQPY